MNADVIVSYNIETLDTLRVTDVSDYSTTPITSVNATRFVFATVNNVNGAATGQTNLVANKEYILVGSGSMTIDGKTFSAGDKFILRVDVSVTPPSTLVINETGYYSPVTNYLPTSDYEEFVPSQFGLNDTTFPDSVCTGIYEVYTTKSGAGSVTVSTSTQFLVIGGGVIDVSGTTYRSGEVFTKSSNFSFTNSSGTNYVVALESSVTFYFQTYKEANQVYESYVNAVSNGVCPPQVQSNLIKVHSLLHANILNFEKNLNVDLQAMQNSLDTINTIYANTNPYS